MATEVTSLKAVLQDEMSRPIRRLRGEVDSTHRSMQRLARNDVQTPLGRFARGVATTALALERADSPLRRFSGWLTDGIARGTKIAAAGLGILTIAVTSFGLRSASQFQQTRIAFDGFLGSAMQGKALFEEMQALNLQTPFQLPAITSGATKLLGFGFTGEQIEPLMKAATDVGAGLGGTQEVLDRILLNLGQVRSQGKVTGRELRDFAVLGVPGYELVASILGKSREQIQAMGDDAEVSGDQFIQAFIGMQGPLGRFSGMAEKQMGSLAGQWSNFMDVLNVRLADEANPLTQALTTALPQLSTAVGGLLDTVGPPLFSFVGIIANGVGKLIPIVEPILLGFARGLEHLARASGPLIGQLEPLGGELGDAVLQFFTEITPVVPELVDVFVAFVGILPSALSLLADLIQLSTPLLRLVDGLLGFGPVNDLAGALLLTLAGYRILGPLAKMGFDFAASLMRIALGQQAVAATSGAGAVVPGGVGGGVLRGAGGSAGIGALGLVGLGVSGGLLGLQGITSSAQEGMSMSSMLSSVGGGGALGAAIGTAIAPGIGTLIGGGIGGLAAGVGSLFAGSRHTNGISDADRARARATTQMNNDQFAAQFPDLAARIGVRTSYNAGGITIISPQSNLDIEESVYTGMKRADRDDYERGPSA